MSVGNNLNTNNKQLPFGGAFAAGVANNGLSVSGGKIQLGQDVGAVGNPANLLNNREIPLNGFVYNIQTGGNHRFVIDPTTNIDRFGDIDGAITGMQIIFDYTGNRYFISNSLENFFNIDAINRTSVWSMNRTAMQLDETNRNITLQTDSIVGGISMSMSDTSTDPLVSVQRSAGGGHLGVTNPSTSNTYNSLFAGGAGWTLQVVHAGNNFGLTVVRAANDGGGANMAFYKTKSAQAGTKVAIAPAEGVGSITFMAVANDNATISDCVSLRVNASTVNAGSVDGNFQIQTRSAGSAITERFRVDDAGSIHIGPAATNNASALLQIDSTTKGFLMPRMSTAQKNAIAAPATGLMVYDTGLNKLAVFTGAAWETVTSV